MKSVCACLLLTAAAHSQEDSCDSNLVLLQHAVDKDLKASGEEASQRKLASNSSSKWLGSVEACLHDGSSYCLDDSDVFTSDLDKWCCESGAYGGEPGRFYKKSCSDLGYKGTSWHAMYGDGRVISGTGLRHCKHKLVVHEKFEPPYDHGDSLVGPAWWDNKYYRHRESMVACTKNYKTFTGRHWDCGPECDRTPGCEMFTSHKGECRIALSDEGCELRYQDWCQAYPIYAGECYYYSKNVTLPNSEASAWIGCWTDDWDRAFKHGPKQYGYTYSSCGDACSDYKYFALQNNGWCSCDNEYEKAGYTEAAESDCGNPCAGDTAEACGGPCHCGGNFRNAVYAVGA